MIKVSVIIPSYNHIQFVEKTITSVLQQSYPSVELIVLDDGSKDGSPEILKKLAEEYKFKLILKQNEGICATLNKGIKESSGDMITFIASDDYMPQERIAEQVKFMQAHSDIEVVAGGITLIDNNNVPIGTKKPAILGNVGFDDMLKRNVVSAPTAMFRREVFQKYGLYREDYAFEDYYMWLRMLSMGGKIYNTNSNWAFYRINESNFEKRFAWYYKGFVQALSDYLPDLRAQKMIQKYTLIFCVKMSLYIGSDIYKKYEADTLKLPAHFRIIIKIITLVPEFIRRKVLMFLLKSY